MNTEHIDPHEIERLSLLALILEPLPEKLGCTTRTVDLDEARKLEFFLASGINIGRYFFELAVRVKNERGQPDVFFDLALSAARASSKNIALKKCINLGLIDLLFTIVLSSLLTDREAENVCAEVPIILKNSSKKDVAAREEFRSQSLTTSRSESKRSFAKHVGGDNLYENHLRKKKQAESLGYVGGALWADEFLKGLPLLQLMVAETRKHLKLGLLEALKRSYEVGLTSLPHHSAGFTADFTAATCYLLLREVGDKKIIV